MSKKIQSQSEKFQLLIATIFDWHRCNLISVSGKIDMHGEIVSIVYLCYMLG